MWRDDAYLLDMLLAAKEALAFSADLSWDVFRDSSLHQRAIVHNYFRPDLVTIWRIILEDVPPLIEMIEPLAPPEEP